MKTKQLYKVPKNKIGRINYNNVRLEPHEYSTVFFLALLGFDIEFIAPSNTPKNANPDIAMLDIIEADDSVIDIIK